MYSVRKKINTIMKLLNQIKSRWDIHSNTQFIIILIVFAITGSLALYLSQPILDLLQIKAKTNNQILYYSLRLIIIFPIYQIVLIIIGTLFGQFNFFWSLEKKTMTRLLNIFIKKMKLLSKIDKGTWPLYRSESIPPYSSMCTNKTKHNANYCFSLCLQFQKDKINN